MTRLIDIGSLQSLISGSAIARLPIWIMPVTQISSLAMKNLVIQIRQKMPALEGRKIAGVIASELYQAKALGEIPECPATHPESFKPRLCQHDLQHILGKFTPMERRLIVFALLTDEHITLAARTTHANLRQRHWPDGRWRKALAIARRAPRHTGSEWVFWADGDQQKPCPMPDIDSKFRRATKMRWEVLAELFELYLKEVDQGRRTRQAEKQQPVMRNSPASP
ncbi:hypothetical protein [Geopseudomonas aromaticivorans]